MRLAIGVARKSVQRRAKLGSFFHAELPRVTLFDFERTRGAFVRGDAKSACISRASILNGSIARKVSQRRAIRVLWVENEE